MLFFFQCLIDLEIDSKKEPYQEELFIAVAVSAVVLPAIALIIGVAVLVHRCTSKPNRVGRAKVEVGQWQINN